MTEDTHEYPPACSRRGSHLPSRSGQLLASAEGQTIVSTHSSELLSDESIASDEVVILEPSKEGTTVSLASEIAQVESLLAAGVPVGEAVLPRTAPRNADQLAQFGG